VVKNRLVLGVLAKKVEKFSIIYWENRQSGAILKKETFLLTKRVVKTTWAI